MPSVPWRFSRCCAALLALLISAVGGLRVAVDQAPASRGCAVAVVRDLAGLPLPHRSAVGAWRVPPVHRAQAVLADRVATPTGHQLPAPALLCGSARGPRAP